MYLNHIRVRLTVQEYFSLFKRIWFYNFLHNLLSQYNWSLIKYHVYIHFHNQYLENTWNVCNQVKQNRLSWLVTMISETIVRKQINWGKFKRNVVSLSLHLKVLPKTKTEWFKETLLCGSEYFMLQSICWSYELPRQSATFLLLKWR